MRIRFKRRSGIAAQTRYQYSETLTNWIDLLRDIDFIESTVSNTPDEELVETLLTGTPTNLQTAFFRIRFEEEE